MSEDDDTPMRLDELETFVAVCSEGSFTSVAEQLGVSTSTIARRVTRLEHACGVPLLVRETVGVRPTPQGAEVRARAERILHQVTALRREVSRQPEVLRVIAAPALAQSDGLLGLLSTYGAQHPHVQVELESSARRVDLTANGIDVALRLHLSPLRGAPSLMSRRLGRLRGHVYAAPHLAKAQQLAHPDQLVDLPVVSMGAGLLRNHWSLEHPEHGTIEVPVRPALRLSDLVLVRQAAIAGHGVALLPPFLADGPEAEGRLVRLLPDWSTPTVRLSVLWTASDPLPPRVRAFLDLLAAWEHPWSSGSD